MAQYTEVDLVNTAKESNSSWEIHQAGCADIAKTVKRYQAKARTLAATTLREALDEVVDGELRDMGYGDNDVHVFPCVQS